MRDLNYTREKLFVAIRSLATGRGDVRARLVEAYDSFHVLTPEDFPVELQNDWRWVMDELTRYGVKRDPQGRIYYNAVENTMRRVRRETAGRIAERIFWIYLRVEDRA